VLGGGRGNELDSAAAASWMRIVTSLRRRRRWLITVGVVVSVGSLFASRAGFSGYRVSSSSMEPTLHCAGGPFCERLDADEVLASSGIYSLRPIHREDIVVFHPPKRRELRGVEEIDVEVKRVVGLPGEEIEERRGYVYIDGRRLHEPYVKKMFRGHRSFPRRRVASDAYFLLGDNRIASMDSRDFGPIDRSEIVGKVVFIIRPAARAGFP
jgi:signal peptidase I